uniref:Uncharacterized protein LOC111121168 n=1 Tax=Crassostrea virginica TaxID=6565 RepID=A0A8B8CQE2_CRAVI|nr:uncharacterized protein LOC111121168 [Crassostrea virginica]
MCRPFYDNTTIGRTSCRRTLNQFCGLDLHGRTRARSFRSLRLRSATFLASPNSGQKTWTLIPTPECEDVCSSMNVTVSKGDIIVLDTNQWYHATYIHPGEISITIGSEYD